MMNCRFKSLVLILLTIFVFVSIPDSNAENKIPEEKPCKEFKKQGHNLENVLPLSEWSKTEHILKIGDYELRYSANAGVLPVKVDKEVIANLKLWVVKKS